MSHFTVLVVTPAKPTADTLDAALLPYHEFECTGIDAYVENVNETEQYRADFHKQLDSADGKPDARQWLESWAGIKSISTGEQPMLSGKHKYGWAEIDDAGNITRVIRRTNPNARWDWYQIGGRWTGLLLPKNGADTITGKPGVMGSGAHRSGACDALAIANLDFEAMKAEAVRERRQTIETVRERAAEKGIAWERVVELWRPAATAYPGVLAAWEAAGRPGRLWEWIKTTDTPGAEHLRGEGGDAVNCFHEPFGASVPLDRPDFEVWVEEAPALSTFAVLKDGEWLERGKMGWWAFVSNEKNERSWQGEVDDLIKTLKPTDWITIIDCHI